MIFSSMIFLWVFLPVTLILYFLITYKEKNCQAGNILLLIASLIFYAWGEPVYIFLMIGSVTINYFFGRLFQWEKYRKKWVLACGIGINLGILGFFKYFNFFATYLNRLAGKECIPLSHFALPLGISFYTFQAMSYVIDVYKGEVDSQKNYLNLLLYVSFFPQLVAGPIVKYKDIEQQILNRTNTVEKRFYGVKRFIYGLGKKVLISNVLGKYVDMVFSSIGLASLSTGLVWLLVFMYTLQIYYDFSGYSDMAIGLGYLFGFEFKENFNYPYTSRSIREFWRHWHISLSSWFMEYVYIPLGGNRKGKFRTYCNLFLVFLLTGFWHGASLTFLFWGLFHGFFIILERIWLGEKLEKKGLSWFSHIYCLLVVMAGWVFFRANGMREGISIIKAMFCYQKGKYNIFACLNFEIILTSAAGFLLCGILQRGFPRLREILYDKENQSTGQNILLMAILFLCILSLSASAYNPFIYFRF